MLKSIPGACASAAVLCCAILQAFPASAQVGAPSLPSGCSLTLENDARQPSAPSTAVFPPIQLQVRTPVEPTVLPSGDLKFLLYELHLHNFSTEPVTVMGMQVVGIAQSQQRQIATFNEAALEPLLRQVTLGDGPGNVRRLGVGQGIVMYVCLAFSATAAVPARLRHEIYLDRGVATGPEMATDTTRLRSFGRPLSGAGWKADNNAGSHSHHRLGLWVADGIARISRRYAIDWKKYDSSGRTYAGNAKDLRSYFSYGERILAVADGTVVAVSDGYPDNAPKNGREFTPALPPSAENIGGNYVVLDIGDGQYAGYYHLQPGSVRVKLGERVKRGILLARVGNSGDARWPHLHFQVTDRPDVFASEGLPYVFERYRSQIGETRWQARQHEYPMGDLTIDFGLNDGGQ